MRDGPRCFPPDSSCPAVLRYRLASGKVFAYGAVTLCGPAFQPVLLTSFFGAAPALLPRRCLATPAVWAPPLSLATTRGIIVILFSCRYLDVSVPCVRSLLGSVPGSLPAGSPIRISADLGIFAPPRGFSQLVTSFFASESQGIHRLPLLTFCSPHFTCGLIYLKLALLVFYSFIYS